jgi:hypothetical protein
MGDGRSGHKAPRRDERDQRSDFYQRGGFNDGRGGSNQNQQGGFRLPLVRHLSQPPWRWRRVSAGAAALYFPENASPKVPLLALRHRPTARRSRRRAQGGLEARTIGHRTTQSDANATQAPGPTPAPAPTRDCGGSFRRPRLAHFVPLPPGAGLGVQAGSATSARARRRRASERRRRRRWTPPCCGR